MRPLTATIRLSHLRHNYQLLKRLHGNKMLAVVKADAYGHGAVRCARALADLADGFAVATLDEGIELRQAGVSAPIVMLEGVFEPAEYAAVDEYRLWPGVQNQWQLESLLAHRWREPVTVWLKMDSGMHRVGFFPQNFAPAHQALRQSQQVAHIVNMTHFARADEPEQAMTTAQLAAFDTAVAGLSGAQSLANSAAIIAHPAARRDWGRAGIALYGIEPFPGACPELKPVMRLTSRIFAERTLQPGEPVGYGASFITERSTRIGIAACGYADGYPRTAQNGCPLTVNGQPSRLIGRVSMDMLAVELDHHQGVGSEVELWGDAVSVATVAQSAGTISYELLCHIKRAHYVYQD